MELRKTKVGTITMIHSVLNTFLASSSKCSSKNLGKRVSTSYSVKSLLKSKRWFYKRIKFTFYES
jgi:hypothetical protein